MTCTDFFSGARLKNCYLASLRRTLLLPNNDEQYKSATQQKPYSYSSARYKKNLMELVNILAENYAAKFTSPEDDVLKYINDETYAHHPHAHMLSGHVQGKLLEFISSMVQPKYILEIGTFTGYSALCLAKGLQANGELHTIEIREEDFNTCAKNIALSPLQKKIHLHLGEARQIIPSLPYEWDIVFIDADKTGYIEYYEMVLPRLSANGVILADNVFFHGEVLAGEIKNKSAKAIDDFNRHVAADARTEQVILSVRDGLMLIKKQNQ